MTGLCGSEANTATESPALRKCDIKEPMSVLLPAPPLPVMPTTRVAECPPSGTGIAGAAPDSTSVKISAKRPALAASKSLQELRILRHCVR